MARGWSVPRRRPGDDPQPARRVVVLHVETHPAGWNARWVAAMCRREWTASSIGWFSTGRMARSCDTAASRARPPPKGGVGVLVLGGGVLEGCDVGGTDPAGAGGVGVGVEQCHEPVDVQRGHARGAEAEGGDALHEVSAVHPTAFPRGGGSRSR